jgi:hypothetical protein
MTLEDDLAAGRYTFSVSSFYSNGNPVLGFDLIADGRVVASAERRFLDASAERRSELSFQVGQPLARGSSLSVRARMVSSAPRPARIVLNTGPTDGRESFLRAPLLVTR